MTASVDIRHASDRRTSTTDWLDSKHSFSFGGYYDPSNTHHGLLVVNNDDVVAPGTGFDTHPHRDMEIVTWVLRARWRTATDGNSAIYPGLRSGCPPGQVCCIREERIHQ
jgi:redox-sensitive bicupin YhaK (pirin superfamily)